MKARSISGCQQRGAALALVLWAVFVMSTIVIVIAGLVEFDLDLENLSARRLDARQLALTGVAYATHPKIKRGDPLLFQVFPDGNRLEVEIASEDARININQVLAKGQTDSLVKLFKLWGLDEKTASVASDCLKDWVDRDEFHGLNGAEASDLNGTDYSVPENRPFLSIDEMRAVKGMDAVALAKPDWADYFSVRSSGKLDLQSVSADLMKIYGTLSSEQANAVVAYRNGPDQKPGTTDDAEIASVEALAGIVPLNPAQRIALDANFGVGSDLRRVKSRGYCGKMEHQISIVVAAGQTSYFEWSEK